MVQVRDGQRSGNREIEAMERYEKVIAGLGMEIVERFKTLTGMEVL